MTENLQDSHADDCEDRINTLGDEGFFVLSSDEEHLTDMLDSHQMTHAAIDCDNLAVGSLRSLRRRLNLVVRWDTLLSLLCLDGNTVFTERQYSILCAAVRHGRYGCNLMSPKRVNGTLRRSLLRYSYPGSDLFFIAENIARNFYSGHTRYVQPKNAPNTAVQNCVRLIYPSEWAKVDVACHHCYSHIYCSTTTNTSSIDIEYSAIVRDREAELMATPCIRVGFKDLFVTVPSREGDKVYFPCGRNPDLDGKAIKGWTITEDVGMHATDGDFVVSGILGPTIGVGFTDEWNESHACPDAGTSHRDYIMLEQQVSKCLRIPSKALKSLFSKKKGSSPHMSTGNSSQLGQSTLTGHHAIVDADFCAGDTITFLRPTACEWTDGVVCVFHTSPISPVLSCAAEKILWLKVSTSNGHGVRIKTIRMVNVIRIAYFFDTDEKLAELGRKSRRKLNRGRLDNGERFLVYRVALYVDGFQENKSSRQSRSVAGFYLLPVGFPLEMRNSERSVRVICLTPHGLCNNSTVLEIMSDLERCATQGVVGFDSRGYRVRIFIDTVALFGDLPQASAFTDALGHCATAFCGLCTIRRRKGNVLPETNYSNEFHSRRTGFMRFNARRGAIRRDTDDKSILRALGFISDSKEIAEGKPAVVFAQKLHKLAAQGPGFKRNGSSPCSLVFDYALSIPALPDHVMSGIISYTMNACFDQLEFDHTRKRVEMRIVSSANMNGLDVKRHILSWEKTKRGWKYSGVASNSMSSWYSVLLVASRVFLDVYSEKPKSVFLLPIKLQEVMAIMYRWPKKEVEGMGCADWEFANRADQVLYHHAVADRAVQFLHSARTEYTVDQEIGKYLDKPIVHRLLEIVMHTIPLYGHARICSEMILEHTHQQFKSWLQRNTHCDAHITATEKAVSKDWLWRISSLNSLRTQGTRAEEERALVGLRRLLIGESGVDIDDSTENGRKFLSDFESAVDTAMSPPVPDLLRDCEQQNMSWYGQQGYTWSVLWKDTNAACDPSQRCFLNKVVSLASDNISVSNLAFFRRARFMQKNTDGNKRAYKHNVVQAGDGVSAICRTQGPGEGCDGVIETRSDGNGYCRFFAVISIIGNLRSSDVWLVVSELMKCGSIYTCDASVKELLKLEQTVRRVCLVHKCDDHCIVQFPNGMAHSKSTLQNGSFYVLSRKDGFPPFLG